MLIGHNRRAKTHDGHRRECLAGQSFRRTRACGPPPSNRSTFSSIHAALDVQWAAQNRVGDDDEIIAADMPDKYILVAGLQRHVHNDFAKALDDLVARKPTIAIIVGLEIA